MKKDASLLGINNGTQLNQKTQSLYIAKKNKLEPLKKQTRREIKTPNAML